MLLLLLGESERDTEDTVGERDRDRIEVEVGE